MGRCEREAHRHRKSVETGNRSDCFFRPSWQIGVVGVSPPAIGRPSPRQSAREAGQFGAAVRATELLGIEIGMFVRRTDNRHGHSMRREFSDLSPEEQRIEAERLITEARAVIEEQKLIEAQEAVAEAQGEDS
jgi:hypothetical protein